MEMTKLEAKELYIAAIKGLSAIVRGIQEGELDPRDYKEMQSEFENAIFLARKAISV